MLNPRICPKQTRWYSRKRNKSTGVNHSQDIKDAQVVEQADF